MKKYISIILAMVMMFVCAAPAFAVQAEPEQTLYLLQKKKTATMYSLLSSTNCLPKSGRFLEV